jgi:raffinose/stachyose/melibiose transport system permease protein
VTAARVRPAGVMRHPRAVARATSALLIIVLFLLPVLYVVMIAFESPGHFLKSPLTPPASPAIGNFGQAWAGADLARELVNTVIYSVAAAAIATVLALFIAFPIARRLIRRSGTVYGWLGIGLFLPLAIIPLFIEARTFGLYDNQIGYIILHVEPGIPLGVVLLTAFISSVPGELDEAAWMEGAGYLHYLARVVVPLTRPALLITFLYALLGVWNDIIGPVVLLSNPSLFPITRGIYNFYGSNQSEWTLLAAAVVIASLPLVILFAASQRQLIRASVAGSVKG